MTYVPPDRDGDPDAPDRTRPLPAALPSVGNGIDSGAQTLSFRPEAAPPMAFDAEPVATAPPALVPERAPRDRIVFQLLWETVLLLLVAGALFMVYRDREAILGPGEVGDLLDAETLRLAPLLLVVTALGLSLRLGAVNLALPALTILVMTFPTLFVGADPLLGLAATVGAAAALTIVYCLLNLVFRVPPWMAGLAGLFAIGAAAPLLAHTAETSGPAVAGVGFGDGASIGLWCFAAVALMAIAGGLIGLAPAVRDRLSDAKSAATGTGPRRPGGIALLVAGTFGAGLLAALAGYVPTLVSEAPVALTEDLPALSGLAPDGALRLLPFVLVAVLLGGTGLWGRRGGVAGGVLATVGLWAGLLLWSDLGVNAADPDRFERWTGVLYLGLLAVGLVIAFTLNHLGRPAAPDTAGLDPEAGDEPAVFTPARPSLFDPTVDPAQAGAPVDTPRL